MSSFLPIPEAVTSSNSSPISLTIRNRIGEVILAMEGNNKIDARLRKGELGLHPERDFFLTTQRKFKKILFYVES